MRSGRLLAAKREEVHFALTELYAPGGALNQPPTQLVAYFDDLAVVRTAKAYMSRQNDVSVDGQAVVVTAGPPGAGKTEALRTMALNGYRVTDPDVAKDLLLKDAEAHGLLAYRNSHVLPAITLAKHIATYPTRRCSNALQLLPASCGRFPRQISACRPGGPRALGWEPPAARPASASRAVAVQEGVHSPREFVWVGCGALWCVPGGVRDRAEPEVHCGFGCPQ
ncbi:hypothetical protein ABH924_004709 [Arthrobacter sp. GAS37]